MALVQHQVHLLLWLFKPDNKAPCEHLPELFDVVFQNTSSLDCLSVPQTRSLNREDEIIAVNQ